MKLRYSRLKVFHHTDRLLALPRSCDEIKAPVNIRIKPTNVCNHNCRYCAYRVSDLQLGKDMVESDHLPREMMLEIIDDAAAMGVEAFTFSGGGEPFCYPYFEEALSRLAGTDIQFAALTNGTRLRGDAATIFRERGTWVRISIDGWDGPSYAAYRGVSEKAFAKVIDNIESFSKSDRQCYLGTAIVVDEMNASHVYALSRLLKESGADSVKISPVIVSNSGEATNAYHRELAPRVRDEIARIRGDLVSDGFELFDSYHMQLESFEKAYDWCPYIQLCPVIGANGALYSCHDKAYNDDTGRIGDLGRAGLKTAWFARKSRFFEIDPSRDCNHHCVVDGANKMILEYLDIDTEHSNFI